MIKTPLRSIIIMTAGSVSPNCDKIIRGINFWTVNSNTNSIRLIFIITPSTHLWKGGTPNLKMIAPILKIFIISIAPLIIVETRNTTDADLWEIKYFTPVIIESSLDLPRITGMMHNIFTSRHTHWSNKLSTLIAPKMQPANTTKYPIMELKYIIEIQEVSSWVTSKHPFKYFRETFRSILMLTTLYFMLNYTLILGNYCRNRRIPVI